MTHLNGRLVEQAELERIALTNYGHFTSLVVDNQQVRGLALHLERLERDCAAMFDVALDLERVKALILQAADGKVGPCVVRVTVCDPQLQLGQIGADAEPQALVTIRETTGAALPPIRVQPTCYGREMPEIKHIGLCASLYHRRRAQRAGFDDVLFTDQQDLVSEGGTWNVVFFDGQDLVWPEAPVLAGVTMALLRRHYPGRMTQRPIALSEVSNFEAAFATNAVVGVRPIAAIGAHRLADKHPLLTTLQRCYQDVPFEAL